jgi:hypothetical protein
MGQVVYDNLFWNRTFKDLAMASVRSVGWNLGTIRELGGGMVDLAWAGEGRAQGRGARALAPRGVRARAADHRRPVRRAYQMLRTGEGPSELKDYFYPKTGELDPDGNPERVQVPSYMKDLFAYAGHPWETVKHKVSPAAGSVFEMLENEDFYGDQIRNPDDPLVKQVKQEARTSRSRSAVRDPEPDGNGRAIGRERRDEGAELRRHHAGAAVGRAQRRAEPDGEVPLAAQGEWRHAGGRGRAAVADRAARPRCVTTPMAAIESDPAGRQRRDRAAQLTPKASSHESTDRFARRHRVGARAVSTEFADTPVIARRTPRRVRQGRPNTIGGFDDALVVVTPALCEAFTGQHGSLERDPESREPRDRHQLVQARLPSSRHAEAVRGLRPGRPDHRQRWKRSRSSPARRTSAGSARAAASGKASSRSTSTTRWA